MPYNEVTIMDVKEILRRLQAGQSENKISEQTGRDRKTIRKYKILLKQEGINVTGVNLNNPDTIKIISELLKQTKRKAEKREIFLPYKKEIDGLLSDSNKKLKLKSVYEIINKKHDLEGKASYSSFKRFVTDESLGVKRKEITCRIETPPGRQLQVDYAKMGMLYDPIAKRRRTVYAFIGTLSYSRHKYVEFVYKQDQASFVQSHVNMFNFFGGIPETIVIDNLKAGVIKPDLYNPLLNRSYAEMAEHYNCFIDTARVRSPKDKPKVERDVQTVREEFKKLQILNENLNLYEANEKIKHWLTEEYGKRKHGTTQQEPLNLFNEIEKPMLLELPVDEFQICQWKQAKVHPDCYIQVVKKAYSIPYEFVGKQLWVKIKPKTIEAFYNEELIKIHTIPNGYRQTDYNDFPENIKNAVDTGLPLYLQTKAQRLGGSKLSSFINKLLRPHAFINLRRAQAIISIAERYPSGLVEYAASEALKGKRLPNPKEFKKLLETIISLEEQEAEESIALSEETFSYLHPDNYFTHN